MPLPTVCHHAQNYVTRRYWRRWGRSNRIYFHTQSAAFRDYDLLVLWRDWGVIKENKPIFAWQQAEQINVGKTISEARISHNACH